MTRRYAWIIVPALALAACAGKQQAATPAADTTAVAPAVVDSAAPSPADSTAKPAATTKAPAPKTETGDYDQTIKPRFKVDEKTGKIDTIKKP
jgi:multidrug efflux pump subunit AcrA (membrane-fusion protein)